MIELRPYQTDVVERTRAQVRLGVRRILIQAATGAGKTVLVSALIRSAVAKGKHVLVLAHRKELIDQMFRTLVLCEIRPGVIMAKDPRARHEAPVQVASVQTLARRQLPLADVVVIDEAHRATAKSYRTICDAYPGAVIIGCSATPERTDGEGLRDMFDQLVCAPDMSTLTEMGFLLPLRFYAPVNPDLRGLPRSGGDYNQRALAERIGGDPTRVGDIPRHWKLHGEGRRTIYFGVNVEDSRNMAAEFVRLGVAAEHLDGDTDTKIRDAVLERLERGETTIVCQCDLLTEGYDLPSLGCVIIGRPTLSVIRYLQMVGRVMRPWQDQTYAIVLDHAGCVFRHGLPSDPRTWSLEGRERGGDGRRESAEPVIQRCEVCNTVRPAKMLRCPTCNGTQSTIFGRAPVEVEGEMAEYKPQDANAIRCKNCRSDKVKISRYDDLRYRVACKSCSTKSFQPDPVAVRQASEDRKRREYEKLERVQLEKDLRPGWVAYAYRDVFGSFPPREWRQGQGEPT